jgi:hypothetical protein
MAIDADGSLVDARGRLRHFGRRAFEKLAADLDRCFVCGIARTVVDFNDEHVIPDWVLRRFNLHSRRITLPNGQQQLYGRYTIRCCAPCNALLGTRLETPVSQLFEDNVGATVENLKAADPTLLYSWLCLVFIKLHLKDREFRADPDRRNPSVQVGDIYDWDGLHHVHSVARTSHSGASVEPSVPGTTCFFEMADAPESFDFGSLSDYSTFALRIGNLGIATVLNDCGYVGALVREYLSHITGPISSIQLREIAARLAYGNTLLVSRPSFWSELAPGGNLTIRSSSPISHEIHDVDRADLGRVIAYACAPLLRKSRTPDVELKIEQLARGEIQFLYHDDGSFISESLQPLSAAQPCDAPDQQQPASPPVAGG